MYLPRLLVPLTVASLAACSNAYEVTVYRTSQSGENLVEVEAVIPGDLPLIQLELDPAQKYQKIYGFGASFTESSAWNLATVPLDLRKEVMRKLFDPQDGAGFTLTRTHINSSDYSNYHYSYVDDGDTELASFSIAEDMRGFTGDENEQVRGIALEDPDYDLVPMILEALSVKGADVRIVASPWSPPSWMKTGETAEMTNGHLLPEYHGVWAEYLSKYISAYAEQGIDLWAITPQNEPLHAHDARWDSNGWTATQARDFLRDHLGPQLVRDGHLDVDDLEAGVRVLIYDHNKGEMNDYVAPTYADSEASQYAWGTAFHWYAPSQQASSDWHAADLAEHVSRHPDKALIHTESSIDIEAGDPIGQYWRKSRDYAGEFVPFDTYAYEIITNMNHGAQGYIEWCIILSNEGKPNPYDNFNSAPVLINPRTDEVIYTPLYYLLSHFSKFIRPEAKRIAIEIDEAHEGVIHTAVRNADGSIVLVAFNRNDEAYLLEIGLKGETYTVTLAPRAMQTVRFSAP